MSNQDEQKGETWLAFRKDNDLGGETWTDFWVEHNGERRFLCVPRWFYDAILADHAEVARLRAALTALTDSATTIVGGLREGWWGAGSGELEEGELQQAEHAIDIAAAALGGEDA